MCGNFILFTIVLLSCIEFGVLSETAVGKAKSKVLSRHKRYVAFPEGSSFSCAGCYTVGTIGNPAPSSNPGVFTLGMNWAIAYELPNYTETANYYHLYKKRVYHNKLDMQRRHRRDLYGKLETIINNMGYNGRECVLRTLCETSQRLVPKGTNMIEEMFRTLFTFPQAKLLPTEPLEHMIYEAAHRLGKGMGDCDRFKCPLSLIDLVKGYYNAPAPDVDAGRSPWAMFSSSFG